jgi:hypothetical protein
MTNPYWLRDPQPWAIEQERIRHNQALYAVGEYAVFALMWHVEDFRDGLVSRCSVCWVPFGEVAEVYGQTSKQKCLNCFGTTFEGGIRNLIVRPIIFPDNPDSETNDRRGVIQSNSAQVETTSDFRIQQHDYLFRGDASRYQLDAPMETTAHAGFKFPYQRDEGIAVNTVTATFEDLSSVAYLIPPNSTTLQTILNAARYEPMDFSAYEIHNAPLIPMPDSAAN